MKIVHAADLHLKPLIWKSRPEISGDAHYSMSQIVEYCRTNSADLLVLAGDIFDSPHPDCETVRFFIQCMSALQDVTAVAYVMGNHDLVDGAG